MGGSFENVMFTYLSKTILRMVKMTHGMERIPDSLGYLVLTEEGAVISSGGDLENDEMTATKIIQLLQTANRIPFSLDKRDPFKRLSVIWDDFMFMITCSNHKVFVSKRKYMPLDPVTT